MSKQKLVTPAEKPADPPATPDPAVIVAGGETTAPTGSTGDPPPPASPQDGAGTAAGTAAQEQAAAADQSAGDPAPRRARAVMPDAAAAEAISGFLADWREDRPAEAASGSYSPHARDRFAEQDHSAIPDGLVFSKGWVFVFDDGRFVAAADMSTAREDVFVPKGQVIQLSAA